MTNQIKDISKPIVVTQEKTNLQAKKRVASKLIQNLQANPDSTLAKICSIAPDVPNHSPTKSICCNTLYVFILASDLTARVATDNSKEKII